MNDTGSKPQTFEEYFAGFPADVRSKLEELRGIIAAEAPGASEKFSYAMPTFYLNGNLVHFAAYRNHIGLYPGSEPVAEFKNELRGYNVSKGAIQLPLDEPLPRDLIRRIVATCVHRNENRKGGGKAGKKSA